MSYDLERLHSDIAQIQHDKAGFGSGRLVAQDLVLTAAHTLWNGAAGTGPFLKEWQVRLKRDSNAARWPFRRGNDVVWHDRGLDLALIRLAGSEAGPARPSLRLRVATVSRNNLHSVETLGYPNASRQADGPRELTIAHGRLAAGQQDRPLNLGVDVCDLPNDPHAGWPGMSGSAVLLREGRDPDQIWVYGVVGAVPGNFNRKLTVARLAEAWRNPTFRELLVAAGAADTDAEDPSFVEIGRASAGIRLLADADLVRDVPAAAEAVSRCKEAIENTYRQVDKLDLLKTVHDALHTVEFEVLRPMEEEGAARGVRPSFAITFHGKKRDIQEATKGREMPGTLHDELVEQLESSAQAFAAAATTRDEAAHARVRGDLNELLSGVSPKLDDTISMTATELRLDRLVELMGMVRDRLPSAASAQGPAFQVKIQDFIAGLDELARLRDKLMVHVREHSNLQRLDSKLRTVCVGGFKPGTLAREWDRARRIRCDLTTPCSAVVTEASAYLEPLESEIEAAVGSEEQGALKLMREYFRAVSSLFREVDSRFKEFTLGLSQLRPSLKVVLDSF
jgi:hypothetical protein